MHGFIVHDERVRNRQDCEIVCPGQFGFVDRYDQVIISFEQRVAAGAIFGSTGNDSELARRCQEMFLKLFPVLHELLAARAEDELKHWVSFELAGEGSSVVGRGQHHNATDAVVDAESFQPVEFIADRIVIPVAGRFGATRLIDNIMIDLSEITTEEPIHSA